MISLSAITNQTKARPASASRRSLAFVHHGRVELPSPARKFHAIEPACRNFSLQCRFEWAGPEDDQLARPIRRAATIEIVGGQRQRQVLLLDQPRDNDEMPFGEWNAIGRRCGSGEVSQALDRDGIVSLRNGTAG